jgi:hypothetical protein
VHGLVIHVEAMGAIDVNASELEGDAHYEDVDHEDEVEVGVGEFPPAPL